MTIDDWIISLENTAAEVAAAHGAGYVDFVLKKYNANSIYDLYPSDYANVFSELYQVAVDN